MAPVPLYCDGCEAWIRPRRSGTPGPGRCPACALPLEVGLADAGRANSGFRRAFRLLGRLCLTAFSLGLIVGSLALGLVTTAAVTPLLVGRDERLLEPLARLVETEPGPSSPRRDVELGWAFDFVTDSAGFQGPAVAQLLPGPGRPGASQGGRDSPAISPTRSATGPASIPVPEAGRLRPSQDAGPQVPTPEPKRIRVRTVTGKSVVARQLGPAAAETHVILPDGQLGIVDNLAYTDDPFVVASAEDMAEEVLTGPLLGFRTLRTTHYLIVYDCDPSFAAGSGRVLEDLYRGLGEFFRKREIPTHEAEFPLVAVVFKTEREFRAHKPVDPEIQAFYELYSNRIFFYQHADRDELAPEVAAVRRPQTVAHEGTHQILQNVGIQPRLAAWPPWLIEGLAEYCSTPVTKKGGTPTWSGLGVVNTQHLVTIRDLSDPDSGQLPGATKPEHIGRPRGMPLVEYLVTKTQLSPTDYALSWAMTHYLAMRRTDEFLAFLKAMSELPPLEPRTPADHLAAFRAAFGPRLERLDKEIHNYLSKLKVKDHLPYYAVTFLQRLPSGQVRRGAMVSQSPSLIRQWLETVSSPRGDPPVWEAVPNSSRTRAWLHAEQWMRGVPNE